MMKLLTILAASFAVLTMPAMAEDAPLRIIYTTHSDSGNTFWLSVKKGMDDACALIKADCQMLLVSKVGDVQGQIANIQAAIAQSPDMIITSIPDNKAFDQVVKEAIDAGIPVIASNVDDLEGAKGNARLAFVGQDFILAGQALGRAIASKFPASGPVKALIGVNAPADNWSRARANGIIMAFKEWQSEHPDRKIVWDEIDAGLDYGTTGDRFGNYLTGNPDLNAYADTGFWDVGAVTVLKDRGIAPGQITMGGFDLVPDVLNTMKQGYIQFHIDQQPYLQGYAPVLQAPLIKKFKLSAYDVNTGSAVVTPDMVDDILQLSKDGYR
ncbi:sugar ABC transporter substrate-binding protein [Mesorhizobium sp. M0622]|uniref:sugar ABC transporter substrate-binding protein n=1 Tax=unclassified Mesorhizobium TaxID=325217 RepID=UPI00333A6EA8